MCICRLSQWWLTVNHQLFMMRGAKQINDHFRTEIRNRQKRQLFRQFRMKSVEYPPSNSNMAVELLKQLKAGNSPDPSAQLAQIAQQITISPNSDNKNPLLTAMKLIDNGAHIYLMDNLAHGIQIEGTLKVISRLLSHEKLKAVDRFTTRGIFEYALSYSTQYPPLVPVCMNILGNSMAENMDNAEIVVANHAYRTLFDLFERQVLTKVELTDEQLTVGSNIMWVLSYLLEIEDCRNYEDQFLEMLAFVTTRVAPREIYLAFVVESIFLVGYSFPDKTKDIATQTLSRLIHIASTESKHLKPLLITIKLLSPLVDFPYAHVSMLAATAPPAITPYCLQTLNSIANKDEQYVKFIPAHDEIWWLKVFNNCLRQEDKTLFVKLLNKCSVNKQWVFALIRELIENYKSSLILMNELLIYMGSLIREDSFRYMLKSHSIPLLLEQFEQSKNSQLQQKAENLLTALSRNPDNFMNV